MMCLIFPKSRPASSCWTSLITRSRMLFRPSTAPSNPWRPTRNSSSLAEVAPDLPRGRGDERRLAQVLLNLVGNAIKFTDVGEVAIEASVQDGAFNIAVRDSGPGISAADQAKLFQEFQQADNSITKKKGGTGLGLAITKRIMRCTAEKFGSIRPSTMARLLPLRCR